MNPRLFRERGDTNALVSDAFGEDGPLSSLSSTNPVLYDSIKQQADTPMTVQDHQKFRSAILGMVSDQVEKESKVRTQIADNQSFMQAFASLDAALPGIKNPDRFTYEEAERRQIGMMFKQAQEIALLDPDASKGIMVDVRKKADALAANTRTQMEQIRKSARLDDMALWTGAQEQVNETKDIIDSLRNDSDERGFLKSPNEALVARAMNQLGRASSLPRAGLGEAAGSAAGATMGTSIGGVKGGLIEMGSQVLGSMVDKVTANGDIKDIIKRLEFNSQLVQAGYIQNRKALADQYAGAGIQFGEKAGEVYAVLDEQYQSEADKIPSKASDATTDKADKTNTLRSMLDEEVFSARRATEDVRPEASAGMRNSGSRYAAAMARQQAAEDDLAIFDDDQRQATGVPLVPAEGVSLEDATKAVQQARMRRQARDEASTRSSIRRGISEALRGYMR